MTTGSSSARSPEYAISALDLPTGETTTTTGTARPPGADPGARTPAERPSPERDDGMWDVDFDDDLPELEPDPDLPASGPEGPGSRQPGSGPHAADVDADPYADPRAHADAHDAAARAYGDPVGDLVRAAVADRPLEEVVDLITTLEKSPQYAQATIDALRAVGVNRSVEDVTRLVGLLTRPPRHSDSADEAIRAAAECRSVEDVTRLMALLHRTPLEPHCGQEAVRAAAAADRPVGTQGHVLTVGDLMITLAVEATVHHLDLTVALPAAPGSAPAGLAAVRATLDGLLGRPVPIDWGDEHYARAATGRAPLTAAEQHALGADAARFPLFG